MLLREWMNKNKHTCKTLSKVIGTSVRNVEKWSRGEQFPKTPMLIKIEECTQGEVTQDDLYKLLIKKRPLKKNIKIRKDNNELFILKKNANYEYTFLSQFKDGVSDALLLGKRADRPIAEHVEFLNINLTSAYKQGYDFGRTMYCKMEGLDD